MSMVSVIMPVHNRFDLVERAVDSVRNQTHRPMELIIVDDCSEPAFPVLPSDLGGIAVTVLRQSHNTGPGGARERGRSVAKGDYLGYLDSDDVWEPDFVSSLVAALEVNPERGMAYATAAYLDGERRGELVKRSDQAHDTILPIMLWGRPWHTSGCLWRRKATDQIGPWAELWNWEDYEHDCRAGCCGVLPIHVARVLCRVRADAPGKLSHTRNDRRKLTSILQALESMTHAIGNSPYRDSREINQRLCERFLSVAVWAADSRLDDLSRAGIREALRFDELDWRGRCWLQAGGLCLRLGLSKPAMKTVRKAKEGFMEATPFK